LLFAGFQDLGHSTIFTRGQATIAQGRSGSSDCFQSLCVFSAESRLLTEDDDLPGAPPEVVIIYPIGNSLLPGIVELHQEYRLAEGRSVIISGSAGGARHFGRSTEAAEARFGNHVQLESLHHRE
jgi:hypothetical protein